MFFLLDKGTMTHCIDYITMMIIITSNGAQHFKMFSCVLIGMHIFYEQGEDESQDKFQNIHEDAHFVSLLCIVDEQDEKILNELCVG